MGIFDKLFKTVGKAFGVEEPPRLKTGVSQKSKTDQAIPIIVGDQYVKAEPITIFKRVSDDDERVGIVAAWCVGVVINSHADSQLYVDDQPFDSNRFRRNVGGETRTYLWRGTFAGGASASGSGWQDFTTWFGWPNTTAFGKGVCHSQIMYVRNPDIFDSEPKFWLKVRKRSLRFLDGSGSMPDAWADNPYAVVEWYMRDPIIGMGLDHSLFGDSFQTAIDWNENNLVTRSAGQGKRFTVNGLIDSNKTFEEILEELQDHSFSKINYIDGKYEIAVKGQTTTAFMDFNDSNIVGKVESEPCDARDKYTRAIIDWVNPDKNFEYDQAVYPPYGDPLYDDALAEANGVDNTKTFKRKLCVYAEEAFEMARILWRESQEGLEVTFTAQAEASQLVQYDVISITDPRRGWNEKLFLVEEKEELDDSGAEHYKVRASAFNPTMYAWSGLGAYVPETSYEYATSVAPAPQNVSWDDSSRTLSWDAPNTQMVIDRYRIIIDGEEQETTKATSVILDLEPTSPLNPTYTVDIISVGLLSGSGNGARVTFSVNTPPTPITGYEIDNRVGEILFTAPPSPSKFYHYRLKYGIIQDELAAGFDTTGTSIRFDTEDGVDYWVYYRLERITDNTEFSSWVEVQATARGLGLYDWVAWADDDQGNGISTTDSSKAWKGIYGSRPTPVVDISNPSLFTWFRNTASGWIFGTGAPSNAIGQVGDSYLDDSTGNIYVKGESGWVGPQGNMSGGDGDKWFSGESNPTATDGTDGDFWINTTTYELFQKTGGVWVSRGIIRGADGEDPFIVQHTVDGDGSIGWLQDKDTRNFVPSDPTQRHSFRAYQSGINVANNHVFVDLTIDTNTGIITASNPNNNAYVSVLVAGSGTRKVTLTGIATDSGHTTSIVVTAELAPEDGLTGVRGPGHFYAVGTAWSDALADTAASVQGGGKVEYDRVTISSDDPAFSETRYWNGSSWAQANEVIDGTLIVNGAGIFDTIAAGTVLADFLDINSIDIEQANWGGNVTINASGAPIGSGLTGTAFQAISTDINVGVGSYYNVTYGAGITMDVNRTGIGGASTAFGMIIEASGGSSIPAYLSSNATALQALSNTSGRTLDIDNTSSGEAVDARSQFGTGVSATSAGSSGIGLYAYNSSSGLGAYIGSNTGVALQVAGDIEVLGSSSQVTAYLFSGTTVNCSFVRENGTRVWSDNNKPVRLYTENGSGAGQQSGNQVKIGWGGSSNQRLLLSVDGSDFGHNWPINATVTSDANSKNIFERRFDALSDVCELGRKGYILFSYKGDDTNEVKIGLTTQDVQPIFGECVIQPNGLTTYQMMDYSALVSPLFTSIYQLNQKVDQQQAEINDLRTRLEAIEAA